MSATPSNALGNMLDQETPDTIRLSVVEARMLGEGALQSLGLPDDEVRILGGVLPFGGHKGYGLSFVIQVMGLLAGAALARGQVVVEALTALASV